jgi:type IV pilus assembly protein PilB
MNRPKNMLIGEMLVEEGIITKEQLKDGLEEQKRTGTKIGEILIRMGYISKEILWTFLGYQMGVPFINLDEVPEIRQDVLKTLPEQLMRAEKLIPVNKQGKVITVVMADPLNFLVVDDLKATTRCEIDTRLSPSEDIMKLVSRYFGFKEEETGELARAKVDDLDDILAAPMGRAKTHNEEPGLKIQRSPYGEDREKQKPEPPPAQPRQAPKAPEHEYKVPQYQPPAPPPPAYAEASAARQSQPMPPAPPQPRMAEAQAMPQAVMSQDTPVNTFLTSLLSESYDAGATDIHVEPMNDKCRIRRRIDGSLYEVDSPPKTLYNGMLNKIKELAQMNALEKNTPQESKLKIRVSGREINIAVYTFPTIYGEKIVLKIIRADTTILPLNKTGMEENVLELYSKAMRMPHGLILIAGPTNSGKATTMYSTINEINDPKINVFSVDDTSSNYIIPGINQTKVNRKNYGQVLHHLAEQDCDVIAVGDIPNKETAESLFDVIAGGHMVFSMLRANDTYSALQAVINFGMEPYVVYTNATAVLAQRLVRKICERCRTGYEPSEDIIKMLGGPTNRMTLYKGKGCPACANTGYKGRTAVFELLPMNEKIKELLISGEPVKKIKEENKKAGMNTIKEAVLLKVMQGITTVEEYMKIS